MVVEVKVGEDLVGGKLGEEVRGEVVKGVEGMGVVTGVATGVVVRVEVM